MKNIIALLALVGIFKTGDAEITGWTTPLIENAANGTGTLSVDEDQATDTTVVTYVATTDASSITYSLVDAVTPFALSDSGALTITAALDYETTKSYTLKVQAVNNADPKGSGTATITVTVNDVNEAPTFAETTYSTTVANNSAAGTVVFTATATDEDGDIITYTIASGDNNNHFAIESSNGEITINSDVTLVACTTYALQIEATDDDSTTSLTGTTTLNIEVTPCSGTTTPSSGATMRVVSTAMICFAALLTILQ